jgi:selenocysteine lyase/cysteine desulfurase
MHGIDRSADDWLIDDALRAERAPEAGSPNVVVWSGARQYNPRAMKEHFSRFLSQPARLHFAAHSHHPWPDASLDGHRLAWDDAARFIDDKWDHVFSTVLPMAAGFVAKELGLTSGASLAFAPNTHELVVRLLSCLPEKPRIVATDSEFHSFERQSRRLEEEGVQVERVPSFPFADVAARLIEACARVMPHLVFFSHVFFNSGAVVQDVAEVVRALPEDTLVVVDGYHGFCAVPTDWAPLQARAFYLAGGYKYAMAGEGACFLHVPEAFQALRPRNTGWYAAFGALQEKQAGRVPYATGGAHFLGATFDPSGLYRLNAVMQWKAQVGLTTAKVRAHAHGLQRRFVAGLRSSKVKAEQLMVGVDDARRGQFLTFRTGEARAVCEALKAKHVDTDARDDRLRFGFGVYQDEGDVDALLERVNAL